MGYYSLFLAFTFFRYQLNLGICYEFEEFFLYKSICMAKKFEKLRFLKDFNTKIFLTLAGNASISYFEKPLGEEIEMWNAHHERLAIDLLEGMAKRTPLSSPPCPYKVKELTSNRLSIFKSTHINLAKLRLFTPSLSIRIFTLWYVSGVRSTIAKIISRLTLPSRNLFCLGLFSVEVSSTVRQTLRKPRPLSKGKETKD